MSCNSQYSIVPVSYRTFMYVTTVQQEKFEKVVIGFSVALLVGFH